MLPLLLLALFVGYLLGSLPFGYLVARAKGVNIFEVGSRNPGATNVRRVLGRGPGNLVLLLDILKGAAAAAWVFLRHAGDGTEGAPGVGFGGIELAGSAWLTIGVAGLIGALLGHSFSCFTRFKGGKGVATGAGGFLVLFPSGMLIAVVVFLLTLAISRYVSLASMLSAVTLPVVALVMQRSTVLVIVSAAVALFVILRHRTNISRLVAGTEMKVGRKASSPPATPAAPNS